MEAQYIRELAEIMKKNGVTRLEIEEDFGTVRMERALPVPPPCGPAEARPPIPPKAEEALPIPAEEPAAPDPAYAEIRSPMVGVFYSAKGPGEADFVTVGKTVQPGDTVCIIEAMKLMNDITADRAGTIAEICVKNGDIVEFGQTLFKLR